MTIAAVLRTAIRPEGAALLLAGSVLYIAWAGHNDANSYHGWVMAYDKTTLQRLSAFVSTPNGDAGGIWQAGAGPGIGSRRGEPRAVTTTSADAPLGRASSSSPSPSGSIGFVAGAAVGWVTERR